MNTFCKLFWWNFECIAKKALLYFSIFLITTRIYISWRIYLSKKNLATGLYRPNYLGFVCVFYWVIVRPKNYIIHRSDFKKSFSFENICRLSFFFFKFRILISINPKVNFFLQQQMFIVKIFNDKYLFFFYIKNQKFFN